LIIPETVITSYMNALTLDAMKGEFRRLAKLIHPDKNKHASAGAAFEKIRKVYESVLGMKENSNYWEDI